MPSVSGTAKDATGAIAQKLVRVYRRDSGLLVGSALSNATTGAWSATTADTTEHFAIMHDAIGDPYFDKVTLSMPLTANLTDLRGHAFSANGNAAISGGALSLDGVGDYLSGVSPDFKPGSNDFTLEAMCRVTSFAANMTVAGAFNVGGTDSAFKLKIYTDGQVDFVVSSNGSAATYRTSAAGVIPINTWVHVAAERQGDTLYLYINGTLSGSNVAFSSAVHDSAHPLLIGASLYNGSPAYFFAGSLKGARLTIGKARYRGNFTAPTVPYLDAVSGGTENALIYDRLIPV